VCGEAISRIIRWDGSGYPEIIRADVRSDERNLAERRIGKIAYQI
jgi:hypothetical protein